MSNEARASRTAAESSSDSPVAAASARRNSRTWPVAAARRPSSLREWARGEMGRHSSRMVMEAGVAMSNYKAKWIEKVDVPTAVLVTIAMFQTLFLVMG